MILEYKKKKIKKGIRTDTFIQAKKMLIAIMLL